jgi:hypothetical protein
MLVECEFGDYSAQVFNTFGESDDDYCMVYKLKNKQIGVVVKLSCDIELDGVFTANRAEVIILHYNNDIIVDYITVAKLANVRKIAKLLIERSSTGVKHYDDSESLEIYKKVIAITQCMFFSIYDKKWL